MGKTVAELLATISSQELTEWAKYFEWKADHDEHEREFQKQAAAAERWVKEG